MVSEETISWPGAPIAIDRYSRRDFLRLLAVGCVAGGVAGSLVGCASTGRTITAPTSPPTPLTVAGRITPENAARITTLAVLQPQDGRVRGVAWSPDGRLVATGSNQYVQVWDAASGRQLNRLSGHADQIFGMAWSSTSGLLASASLDGTVRVWDTRQGRALQVLGKTPAPAIFSVAWSPDGRRLACGGQAGDVLLWDTQTGQRIATWSGPPEQQSRGGNFPFAVWGVAWSPDGRQIVSTRYDGFVLIWDVATGASQVIPKTDTQPNTVAWAPNGLHFAVTDDQGKVILWNSATAARSLTLEQHDDTGWAYGLTWAPDSGMVASSRQSGIIQVWDAQAGKELTLLDGHTDAVWGLTWSPDGLRLASASDDGTARLWGAR